MESKLQTSNLYGKFTLLVGLAFISLGTHGLSAQEGERGTAGRDGGTVSSVAIAATLARDPFVARLATKYNVAEVRQAAEQSRTSNFKDAIPVIEKFARSGDAGARLVLAKFHLLGVLENSSRSAAITLLEQNVADKDAMSMFMLAEMSERSAPAKALALYERAAAAGEPSALLSLGQIAEAGELGLRPNPQLAFAYFKQSSEAQIAAGDFRLANCFDKGIGVSPNPSKATQLYRKAAMRGLPLANTMMARRYFEGIGLTKDPVAAIGWLTRGAQAGSTEAMVLLGQRYELGDVLIQDINRAGQLYAQAAQAGDAAGNFRLGMLYLNGVGTNVDQVRAYVLFDAAKALPAAEKKLDELQKQLTVEQLEFARKKIAEANGGRSGG